MCILDISSSSSRKRSISSFRSSILFARASFSASSANFLSSSFLRSSSSCLFFSSSSLALRSASIAFRLFFFGHAYSRESLPFRFLDDIVLTSASPSFISMKSKAKVFVTGANFFDSQYLRCYSLELCRLVEAIWLSHNLLYCNISSIVADRIRKQSRSVTNNGGNHLSSMQVHLYV